MKLSQILAQITSDHKIFGDDKIIDQAQILDIALDSRKVGHNSIFFALIGKKNDGANFIEKISENQRVVAVVSQNSNFDYQKFIKTHRDSIIIVGDVVKILHEFLQIFYQPLPQNIYAITGTNGKTSCAEFTRQILQFISKKSASIGTLGINCDLKIKSQFADSNLTTPDIVSLYKNLALLKNNGVDDVAIEVSSIGLEQRRIAGIDIKVGAFTNFTQDHLDYHLTMDNYFTSKMLLFNEVLQVNHHAVLNADIKEYSAIKDICQKRHLNIIDYGFNAQTLKLTRLDNQSAEFIYQQECFAFKTNMIGDFQIYNILCALGNVLSVHNLPKDQLKKILESLDNLRAADGRMEFIATFRGAKIFIDFAHSPDAMKNVLQIAKKFCQNNLVVLFGCGGDRDQTKRPLMGQIACQYADKVIISDDNPRSEDPQFIRQQIVAGCDQYKIEEIADRKIAIAKTITMLQDGDVLIIAGKGHEDYQIIGDTKFEFNEEKIVKNAIAEISKSTI